MYVENSCGAAGGVCCACGGGARAGACGGVCAGFGAGTGAGFGVDVCGAGAGAGAGTSDGAGDGGKGDAVPFLPDSIPGGELGEPGLADDRRLLPHVSCSCSRLLLGEPFHHHILSFIVSFYNFFFLQKYNLGLGLLTSFGTSSLFINCRFKDNISVLKYKI